MEDRSNERTETDERVAENATPSPRTTITGRLEDTDLETGLPAGMRDTRKSPIAPKDE